MRGGELAFTQDVLTFVAGQPAIFAFQTRVEVEGGTIAGGPGAEFFPNDAPGSGAAGGIGLFATQSSLLVTGGVFRPGPNTSEPILGPSASLSATDSLFDIRGGDFRAGPLVLRNSRGRVLGGRFGAMEIHPNSCVEIGGGQLTSLAIVGDGTAAFIFGDGFSLPKGTVAPGPGGEPLRLTGTLQDGSALDVSLTLQGRPFVVLASPGEQACSLSLDSIVP